MSWSVEYLNDLIEEEYKTLPGDIRARFSKIMRMIEAFLRSACPTCDTSKGSFGK